MFEKSVASLFNDKFVLVSCGVMTRRHCTNTSLRNCNVINYETYAIRESITKIWSLLLSTAVRTLCDGTSQKMQRCKSSQQKLRLVSLLGPYNWIHLDPDESSETSCSYFTTCRWRVLIQGSGHVLVQRILARGQIQKRHSEHA